MCCYVVSINNERTTTTSHGPTSIKTFANNDVIMCCVYHNVQVHIIRKYIGGKLDKNKSEKEKEKDQKMLNTREKKLSPPVDISPAACTRC